MRSGLHDKPDGDRDIQEDLVDELNLAVAKAKIKEDILKDLEQRKESIKLIGQEYEEELERRRELDRLRMELNSSTSLADTMAQFKELDDQIQGIRNQLQADQADLNAFEARSASARNDSLFFKQLYKGPEQDKKGVAGEAQQGSSQAENPLLDKQVVQQLTNNIKAPAVKEVHSPLRLYVASYLTAVLVYVVASDFAKGAPSLPLDILYGVLAGFLGWNAWQERQALMQEETGDKQ